jgi:hypothetical protein
MTLLNCRPGDRVTVRRPCGNTTSGRVTLAYPHHLVLNAGGRHGTPVVATADNIVRVTPTKTPSYL